IKTWFIQSAFGVNSPPSSKRLLGMLTGRHPPLNSSTSAIYSSSPRPSSPRPSSPVPSEPRSCFRRDGGGGSPSKKRVVFADAIGLALTTVRMFVAEPSHTASTLPRRPSFAQMQSQQWTSDILQRNRLRLSLPRPTLTSQASLTRQQDACVQLESCNVSEHSLSGKVRVNHVSVDKAVHVRVTFDSWRSHHDIPCTFLQQQQHLGGSNVDLFAFDLSLPKHKDPTERGEFYVEFCVAFRPRPGATPHWDNNGGQNYRVSTLPKCERYMLCQCCD
uniref:CBM21 domain-containing protein n=1 Tax=Cyclopterus lumpus TaxID=8103 RepID=A0A8C2Z4W0_CYCLU